MGDSKKHRVPVYKVCAPGEKQPGELELWQFPKVLVNAGGQAGRAVGPTTACDNVDIKPPWRGVRPCSAAPQA